MTDLIKRIGRKLLRPYPQRIGRVLGELGIPILGVNNRYDRPISRYAGSEVGRFFVITPFNAKELAKKLGYVARFFTHDSHIPMDIRIQDFLKETDKSAIYYHIATSKPRYPNESRFSEVGWMTAPFNYHTYVIPVELDELEMGLLAKDGYFFRNKKGGIEIN